LFFSLKDDAGEFEVDDSSVGDSRINVRLKAQVKQVLYTSGLHFLQHWETFDFVRVKEVFCMDLTWQISL